MSWRGLSRYLKVPKDFDFQLEAYLLKDSERRERVETTISIGDIQYHEAKVKIQGEWVEKKWLTIMGVVVDALVEEEEIILASFKRSDGSLPDAAILTIQKRSGETCLIYREPLVILERLLRILEY